MPDGPELVFAPSPQEELRPEPAPAASPSAPAIAQGAAPLERAPGPLPPFSSIPAQRTPGAPTSEDHEEEAERLAASAGLPTWATTTARVHHGPASAALAARHRADAVTVGLDIHLGPGHPPLDSPAGRSLLTHELAHVWQQSTGRAPFGVPQARKRRRRTPGKRFWVEFHQEMGSEELLRTFVAQYYRLTRSQDIERVAGKWHWTPKPRTGSRAEAEAGGTWLNVYNDPADREVAALGKAAKDAVNAETDRRFFAQTGLDPTSRLGSGPQDAELRARWRGVRANLLAEQEQARALNALPDDIKRIMFAGGRTITPDEYAAALDLAARIGKLSRADRAKYLATVNATTTDLGDLEQAIAKYELSLRIRAHDEESYDEAASDLVGMEELYRLWTAKQKAEGWETYGPTLQALAGGAAVSTGTVSPALADPGVYERAADQARARFQAALARSGFPTEAAFLASVQKYLIRFRTQTVNLAMDVLAGYDHMLYVAKLKFRDTDAARTLAAKISATGAASDYAAADQAEAHADLASQPLYDDLPGRGARLYPGDPVALRAEAKQLRATGSAKVVEASGNEPIIDPAVLGRKTDRERLARGSAEDVRAQLLSVIEDRLQDSAHVRAELLEDPERVFSQSPLIEAAFQQEGIHKDSVFAEIVLDHVEEIHDRHLFTAIVVTLISLILAALVPGGGWVAAAALMASAGISTWQAIDALVEYNKGEAEYALGFISDEPSLFWVGVAVVGAALDLGLTAHQLLKASAPALIKLQKPLTEFAAAADLETAGARLRTLKDEIEAVQGLDVQVRAALKAAADAQLALKQALLGGNRLRASVFGLDSVAELLFTSVRAGTRKFSALRQQAQLMERLTELTGLEGRNLNELREAFTRVRRVVDAGTEAGMDEATLLTYVERIPLEAAAGDEVFKGILAEARAWRPPTREQALAEARLTRAHDNLVTLRGRQAEIESDLAARRAGTKPSSQAEMDELAQELEELTGRSERRGVPRRSGEIDTAVTQFEEAMRLAGQAKLDPLLLMRRAFNASKERLTVQQAAQGVDRVGGLLRTPRGVQVDHIVSLQRMTEIEGFEKLTLLERRELAIRPDNLIAMDGAANRSKWYRPWSQWEQAGRFYPEGTIQRMRDLEADVYARITKWIKDKASKR